MDLNPCYALMLYENNGLESLLRTIVDHVVKCGYMIGEGHRTV